MNSRWIWAAMCFTVLWAPLAAAEEEGPLELGGETVVVRYPRGAEREARFVQKNAPEILEEVTHVLMIDLKGKTTVALLNSFEFEKEVGRQKGEWAVAVARSGTGTILVNLGKLGGGNDFYTVLKHEFVHLVLGGVERQAGRRVPLWFHEGVAQWICGRLFAGTRDEFLVAARAGRLPPMSELARSFPASGKWVNIAYAQSDSFVTYLESVQPEASASILARFGRGIPFADAVQETLGKPLQALEEDWRRDLKSASPFLAVWLQNNPGAIWILLFTFGAAATVVAVMRGRARRRELEREWEAEGFGDDDLP